MNVVLLCVLTDVWCILIRLIICFVSLELNQLRWFGHVETGSPNKSSNGFHMEAERSKP